MQNQTMINIENLRVNYGDFTALNINTPLQIQKGDKLAIIGSNGAGKTTFVNAMLGVLPFEGQVQKAVPNEKIGVHLQFNNYNTFLTMRDIMETILDGKLENFPRVMELIAFFHFEDCLKKRFEQLSGGQKQRLTLILVLAQETELVFFDEVTTGLDFETRQELISLLQRWYEGKNATICYITHYYEEIENLADTVLLLEKGEVIAYGKKEDLFEKYCGKGIIVIKNNPENQAVTEGFRKIVSPAQDIALPFQSIEEEQAIITALATKNIDYKRSSQDVEIMSFNAKAAWEKEKKNV